MIFRSQLSHRLSIYPSSPWHWFFYWLDTPVDKEHSKVRLPLISCNFDNRCFPCPTQCWLFLTHKNFCLSVSAWTPMSVIDILWLGLDRALPLSLPLWSRLPSVYWCCSSQPSMVHWLSSSIFPFCLFVRSSVRPAMVTSDQISIFLIYTGIRALY